MSANLGAWAIAILIIRISEPAGAMKWNNEEQFVDGEFPYYPYSNKIDSFSDGLTDDEHLANDFSAPIRHEDIDDRNATRISVPVEKRSLFGKSQKASFYEFKKDSDSVIDATKPEGNKTSLKPAEGKKGLISRLAQKKTKRNPMKSKLFGSRRARQSGWKMEEAGEKPEIQIGYEEQKTQFLGDGSNIKPAELFSAETLQNVSDDSTSEGKSDDVGSNTGPLGVPKRLRPESSPASKPTHSSLKINGPYENNYSGGGFRYTNPSTWLAREIEKFIRRNDYRWLDFMKNNGLGTNGVIVEAKHTAEDSSNVKKGRVLAVGCRRGKDGKKECRSTNQKTLLHQVDELLQDLSQFRENVQNDKSGSIRTRELRKADDAKFLNKARYIRDTRSISLPSFRGKAEHHAERRPHQHRVSPALVENDLLDLKRNIVLYENNLPDEETRHALKDLRLHIKVYVENSNDNSSKEAK